MIDKVTALQDELKAIDSELNGSLELIRSENRSFTQDELTNFEAKEQRKEAVELEIATEKKAKSFKRSEVFGTPAVVVAKKATKKDSENAFRAWMLNGKAPIPDTFKRSCDYVNVDYTSEYFDLKRDQSSDTSGEGIELGAADSIAEKVVAAQKFYGNMESACNVITTDRNYTITIPLVNDTATEGEYKAQNASIDSDDFTFTNVSLNAYPVKSATYKISLELLEDTSYDLAGEIGGWIGERLARSTNRIITRGAGSGSNEGKGFLVDSTEVAAGTNFGLTESLIEKLYFGLDKAYRDNASWVMNDDTFRHLVSVLKSTTAEPIWVNDLILNGPAYQLMGKPVIINNHMPPMVNDTTVKPIAFGDFKNHRVRYVGSTRLVRDNSRFIDTLSVGIFAWVRMDCHLVDAGTHPVVHLKTTSHV